MRAVMLQLNLSAWIIVDMVRNEEMQSMHLAEALHASQSAEADDRVKVYVL